MHYVCSDLHGQMTAFRELLSAITFSVEDEMYVLGDVIDRGPEPLDLLLYICGEPNIHLLLGNHEYMMLESMDEDPHIKRKALTRWRKNGSKKTEKQLEKMPPPAVKLLKRLLEQCPLVIPDLRIGEKHYYLTHAGLIDRFLNMPCGLSEFTEEERTTILWSRALANGRQPEDMMSQSTMKNYQDHTFLFGHTMTSKCSFARLSDKKEPMISESGDGHIICLDCGCSEKRQLGCLRLEDHMEYYIKIES